jgi:glycosyltransferase involved in cell wall biosynthesis
MMGKTMNHSSKLYSISFVIIGLNEKKMIGRCIESIYGLNYPRDKIEIIYVDSGSTDRTLEIASKYSLKIVHLKADRPTPGLACNKGLKRAKGELVQFIGGDSIVDTQWLNNALPYLADVEIAGIIGRRKELFPEVSIYNKLIDITWQSFPLGDLDIPDGRLFKRTILEEVEPHDPDLKAGEHTELGYRIGKRGYKILSIRNMMVYHDADISSIFEYLKRAMRNGYGTAQIFKKYWYCKDRPKRFYSSVIKADIQIILFIAMVLSFSLRSFLIGYTLSLFVGIFILRKVIKTFLLSKNLQMSLLFPFMSFLSRCAGFIGYISCFIFERGRRLQQACK